jgi:hypothetical protein
MSEYQIANNDITIRRVDGACIPPDPDNMDYAAFLKWKDAGGIPDPSTEPTAPTPLTVTEKLAALGLSASDLKSLLTS